MDHRGKKRAERTPFAVDTQTSDNDFENFERPRVRDSKLVEWGRDNHVQRGDKDFQRSSLISARATAGSKYNLAEKPAYKHEKEIGVLTVDGNQNRTK